MTVITTSYKVVGGKRVVDFSAESKVSLLVCFAGFLVSVPSEADLGVSLLYMGNETTGHFPLQDREVAVVVARMVEAIKTCDNDVGKAIKYLSESADVVAEYAGHLLGGVCKERIASKRRIRSRR